MNSNFKVIGLTLLGIKPKFTAPKADALATRPTELFKLYAKNDVLGRASRPNVLARSNVGFRIQCNYKSGFTEEIRVWLNFAVTALVFFTC